jgi:hypothetical protein
MTPESLINHDWQRNVVEKLGGADELTKSARATKAFLRPRAIASAVDLLRIVLAYCLSHAGLRSTAAWASAIDLADLSNVALLRRLRASSDWLGFLVGQALARQAPKLGHGRFIRIVDGTSVPKAGKKAKQRSQLWRIHSAFDLPEERFGHFVLTDQQEGEKLDSIPVVKGEIRLGDRAYMQPDRIATVIEGGGDVVVRAGWKSVRWRGADATPFNLIEAFGAAAERGLIDRPISVERKDDPPLALRLIAVKKSPQAAEAARRQARRAAQREGYTISQDALAAAEWVIIVTSLPPEAWGTLAVLDLYRLRWRIELGFKRLKSLIGLRGPPGFDERSAKPYLLAHLLGILLLEPVIDELEVSPRWAAAA